MKKGVGETWSQVDKMKGSIIPSFEHCGISVALDASHNDEVNIESLPDYHTATLGIKYISKNLEHDADDNISKHFFESFHFKYV